MDLRTPDAGVSAVVPGRDATRTLDACLGALTPLVAGGELIEVLMVDDGSLDATAERARAHPGVQVLSIAAGGPGRARNAGWRAARGEWIWFLDADCVAEPDALARLVAVVRRAAAAGVELDGVGGSYANLEPDSLLARLIHAEIRQRHLAAAAGPVDHLGTFNVLYRRAALERVGGLDESDFNGPGAPGAEDADLSFRIVDSGGRLAFEPESRVGHFHPTRLASYLRAQRVHGYWGARLYWRHLGRAGGHSYSGLADHLQPPLALAALPLLGLGLVAYLGFWLTWPLAQVAGVEPGPALLVAQRVAVVFEVATALGLLAAATVLVLQLPMTLALVRRSDRLIDLAFIPLGCIRAVARGIGLLQGVISVSRGRRGAPVAR